MSSCKALSPYGFLRLIGSSAPGVFSQPSWVSRALLDVTVTRGIRISAQSAGRSVHVSWDLSDLRVCHWVGSYMPTPVEFQRTLSIPTDMGALWATANSL